MAHGVSGLFELGVCAFCHVDQDEWSEAMKRVHYLWKHPIEYVSLKQLVTLLFFIHLYSAAFPLVICFYYRKSEEEATSLASPVESGSGQKSQASEEWEEALAEVNTCPVEDKHIRAAPKNRSPGEANQSSPKSSTGANRSSRDTPESQSTSRSSWRSRSNSSRSGSREIRSSRDWRSNSRKRSRSRSRSTGSTRRSTRSTSAERRRHRREYSSRRSRSPRDRRQSPRRKGRSGGGPFEKRGVSKNSIFIRKVPKAVRAEDIREYFQQKGEVINVHVENRLQMAHVSVFVKFADIGVVDQLRHTCHYVKGIGLMAEPAWDRNGV